MSFDRMATVELQIVMQHCDLRTLLALARCSRFTFAAASNAVAWRGLSPLELDFAHPPAPEAGAWQRLRRWIRPPPLPPLPLAQRLSGSLLRFCDIRINWTNDRGSPFSPVTDAELDALAAIPRLCALNSCGRWTACSAEIESLARRPGLRGLGALVCCKRQLGESSIGALADHCPRLSTVTTAGSIATDPPLHHLPALTDLTVRVCHSGGLTMASVVRCARLRRLDIRPDSQNGYSPRDVHTSLLSPNLWGLERLSIHGLDALHADGRNQPAKQLDWAAAFANLPALRSLHLKSPRGIDELLAAIGVGCAQLHSLSVHSSLVDSPESVGVAASLPSAAVLSALLARRPSLRSVTLNLLGLHGCTEMRSDASSDDRARALIWRHACAELTALAALQHHRLRVTLPSDCVF